MNVELSPLHVRSGYSLLRGTCSLEGLIQRAYRLGYKRLALTDVNNLCGATEFYTLAEEAGLKPITGAELEADGQSVVALVSNEKGYENLCRIISDLHCGEDFSLAAGLAEMNEGLEIVVEDAQFAELLIQAGVDGQRMWLELDPGTQSYGQIRSLIEGGERLGIPLVATGRALFCETEDYEVARLLTAVRLGSTYQNLEAGQLPPESAYLRSAEQLAGELAKYPEAAANNRCLAERCDYELLPRDYVFPSYDCPRGLSAGKFLRQLCRDGVQWRYGRETSRVNERLKRELRIIELLGFAEYFLVVWDIVQYARRRGVPVAGRGSGASSLAAYVLGITNVCPLAFDIPFERFLNERRSDCPDLDIDFCWRIRDEVIEYAFERWGEDHVAMVCTYNTFQGRSALRETAKAWGFAEEQISKLQRQDWSKDDELAGIYHLSRRIVGLPHNLSVHPGGIVIGRMPIDRYTPIQPAPKGVRICQYDKRGVERIGLVKLDLLGNRGLSTVRYTCELIRQRRGEVIDVENLPGTDLATIDLVSRAQTVGCNQLESPAMRHLLKALRPRDIREIGKALALIRPGAASIGMKEIFIRRQRGLEPVARENPTVDAILRSSNGVMLYEDDVMFVAAALLGSSLPEGDQFRKAIQKCRNDRQRLELSREFLGRCRGRGLDLEYAKSMWVQMAKFNEFSFCRAHAASYALLAYGGAYLKGHYPLEFWTAALSNNQSMYHPRVYVEQAKRAGISFLGPDINLSAEEFCIEGQDIRVGLNMIDCLGPVSVETILQVRKERAYRDLTDFLRRTGLEREKARSLILCGAFDGTGRSRPGLMMEMELWFSGKPERADRGEPLILAEPSIPEGLRDYSRQRKYAEEWNILGISTGEHIMAVHRPGLAGLVDIKSGQLARCVGRRVRIAGVLEAQRHTRTQNGRLMSFLTLDDEDGLFEVTVFPQARRAVVKSLDKYGPYLVTGRIEEQYDSITVSAESVRLHKSCSLRMAS